MDEKKLFLLDAYALIYRAYYALIRSPRVTTSGLNTSAIFGFCNTLDEVLRKENPGYIAVCFDPAGGHTFRHDVYPEYKAQRDKQPEDITLAVPYIKKILEAYRIPVIEVAGYEADDVIGTLSRKAEAEGFTTYMMTPDKDYGQLVTPHVFMYRPSLKGQGFEVRGPEQVCERYGIERPSQVIDLLALEGDASDNIPGCPGVGEKTAAKLISEWGSVENLLAHIADLKGALQKKIAANEEQIRFSKMLVTIKTDVPLEVGPDDMVRREPDVDALRALFDELEFKNTGRRLLAGMEVAPVAADEADQGGMGSLFDDPASEGATKTDEIAHEVAPAAISTETLTDGAEIARFLAEAAAAPLAGIALHAPGEEAMRAPLLGVGVAAEGRAAYMAVPPMEPGRSEFMALLEPLLASETTVLCGHDLKRQMVVLHRAGCDFTANYFATDVAQYLLAPEMPHDLPAIASTYLHYRTMDYDLAAPDRKRLEAGKGNIDYAALTAERAAVAAKLKPVLEEKLDENGLGELYRSIELPFVPVLARMEVEGVRIDVQELQAMSRRLSARLASLEQEAYELAGGPFNVGSPTQVGQVLFERLKIDPSAKRTKRGAWSTTEDILEKYAPSQPIVRLILDIRGLKKLLTTYIDALPGLINPETGKIHTTFNQTATATGRISSTNPNLQNIPVRTEDGREIRAAFIADPGDLILSADYSQIELRLIADISGDPEMIEAFRAGEDIHRSTAAKIYHKPLDEVTDNERRNAKTANFGIIYGISAFGLSERLGIPRAEAKELITGYLATYPRVDAYMKESIEKARNQGYVTTVRGRKRYLPDINSRNSVVRGYAERNAINAPLQGSAADIIKTAMIEIDREIRARGYRSRMIMQVHDELIFNVKPEELADLQALVAELMSGAYTGNVPLEVSSGVGKNWLEAH